MEELIRAWRALIAPHTSAPQAEEVGRALLASWSEPHRRYHDLVHLRGVLTAIDELAALATDPDAVRLAAWYHDAVYDGSPDDEERSARRAETELTALGVAADLVAEVARLVRMTVEHDPAPGDRNAEVLSDADLAALAVGAEDYRRNSAAIRSEYAHVSDEAFRAGRARVIEAMLVGPRLFRTEIARRRWEPQARANLQAELAQL
ncbi:metal-dependent phosphohydrolase [[Mycobacterium] wendilense]|uniref:Metal-dependent phosphohydrolase n=1 Tax=[Mycobacterium] wendilense TaxID=3064284 RepID=A0ABM9M868_9MYCO|nr:metal-dependent phosphohydrolase [Mycolicibacterium sp. MU0050]CAJ1578654.1 metal-dependent phosphohydrolase [Mycolicibacterium sp. MU0050]